jgi:hypothetical protein
MDARMDKILLIRQRAFWRSESTLKREDVNMLCDLALDHLERTEKLPKRLDMTIMWIIVGVFFGLGICVMSNLEQHAGAAPWDSDIYGSQPGQIYRSPLDPPPVDTWEPKEYKPYSGSPC